MTDIFKLIEDLKVDFKVKGFDIVSPFKVQDYNNNALHKINDYGRNSALGLIIGCTKQFWEHFNRYIIEQAEIPKDPMNSFCKDTIEQVIKNNVPIHQYQHELLYDWNSPRSGKYVHIQTCGHFAGIAQYDKEIMWSVHPEYGLWFVFRAVLVVNVEFNPESLPQLPTEPILTVPVKNRMKALTQQAIEEGWANLETRLQIRDCCPIGKEKYRYSGDMFDYFYPISRTSREVLETIRSNQKVEK
ncbi:hypothetical protein DLAC_01619 [Tieghemostelium lacteum]|uniref:Cyanocobalamin reductase (cyanide-eliminating) n=1 Tax=Tieghemostelium lacteum TaxID=361077 RepID=A0A152A5V6_TIELA|nr:hypothetical protein DLAC_01619 [Tieghemostelium lacteum]|eukprot:KYR01619.1 hypothetical protein DLAC_01619 [Tieghemostelium lacteum]